MSLGRAPGSIAATRVAEILRDLGMYEPMTAYGFPLPGGAARLVKGGGIACDGRWWIVELNGRALCEPCGTEAKLKTALRKWRALSPAPANKPEEG